MHAPHPTPARATRILYIYWHWRRRLGASEPMPYWNKLLLDYLHSGGVKTPFCPTGLQSVPADNAYGRIFKRRTFYGASTICRLQDATHARPGGSANSLVGIDSVVLGP
jgi:hypothetical protein